MTLEAAVAAINAGQIVGLPTDTVYGLAVDPINPEAVERLFDAKGRPLGKPVGVLAADLGSAAQIGELDDEALELARAHWPGGLTLIVPPRIILADWVGDSQRQTVGLRVPDHPVARELLERTGPLAVTSANRSGEPECLDHVSASDTFGEEVAIYIEGSSPGGEASTVVDATGGRIVVLREGPVAVEQS